MGTPDAEMFKRHSMKATIWGGVPGLDKETMHHFSTFWERGRLQETISDTCNPETLP